MRKPGAMAGLFGWLLMGERSDSGGEGIDVATDRLAPAHPRFGVDAAHLIREARNEAEVFAHMLFADRSHRRHAAGRDRDRRAEEALQHEEAFGMMARRAGRKSAVIAFDSSSH